MWDVWIHILGIRAECVCWGWGQSCRGPLIRLAFARHLSLKGKASRRPGVPPLRRRSGTPRRRVRKATPYKRGGGRVGTPAPTAESEQKQRAHNLRPYTTITNSSAYRKRDRSGTCPLKRRGETQFRTKFLCLLSFSKKVGYTGPWRKRSIIS